jgi:hypothetical protein
VRKLRIGPVPALAGGNSFPVIGSLSGQLRHIMDTRRSAIGVMATFLLAFAGCAVSPVDEQRRKDMEADVDDILSYEHDPAEVGEPRTCLQDADYRSYRALGKRHLLFRGRQGRLWVNVLRGRCQGLNSHSIFIMKPSAGGRLCNLDRFELVDRFDTFSGADTTLTCVLGEFKPVTEAQVKEIENRLEMR